jgi:predicted nucleic acid-binding protein
MTRHAVVLDTNVLGSSLRPRRTELWESALVLAADATLLASFMSVAELQFGASLARWGASRQRMLDRLIFEMGIIWPGPTLLAVYADLRAWATRSGHGLAGRAHEADRWIATTAVHLGVPLLTSDRIFTGVPGLDVHVLPSR